MLHMKYLSVGSFWAQRLFSSILCHQIGLNISYRDIWLTTERQQLSKVIICQGVVFANRESSSVSSERESDGV